MADPGLVEELKAHKKAELGLMAQLALTAFPVIMGLGEWYETHRRRRQLEAAIASGTAAPVATVTYHEHTPENHPEPTGHELAGVTGDEGLAQARCDQLAELLGGEIAGWTVALAGDGTTANVRAWGDVVAQASDIAGYDEAALHEAANGLLGLNADPTPAEPDPEEAEQLAELADDDD